MEAQAAEVALGHGIALLGGQAIPFHRLGLGTLLPTAGYLVPGQTARQQAWRADVDRWAVERWERKRKQERK